MELRDQIAAFVAYVQAMKTDHMQKNFPNLSIPTFAAEYGGKKWCKIVETNSEHGGQSVYAFICLQDGFTKALGPVKVGDIHRQASWHQPAKHARGNVSQAPDYNNCAGPYGIAYLK